MERLERSDDGLSPSSRWVVLRGRRSESQGQLEGVRTRVPDVAL